MDEKTCNDCKVTKPISEFGQSFRPKRGVYKVAAVCKTCALREKRDNRERDYDAKFRRQYGITWSEYQEISTSQGNVCAICHKPETAFRYKYGGLSILCVDHDHKTGEVRGLLCRKCNTAIGLLGDSPATLYSALGYLMGRGGHHR